ncbi:MAG: glycosyltransferase [Calditrichia bacterium]
MKILFISGSLGLGHITRDLAIAQELRRSIPGIEIYWLAAHPATLVLENAGENILPEASQYSNENVFAENCSDGTRLNLLSYLFKAKNAWKKNVEVYAGIMNSQKFDLVIGDETYEISIALRKQPELRKSPFVMIYDFVGLDTMTGNPLEKLGVYFWNRKWAQGTTNNSKPASYLSLFIGEPEDIPDKSFGFMLPNRREFAKANYKFIGPILPFDPEAYVDRAGIRRKLGYDSEPLVVASIGGTSIGKGLLELCGKAYPMLRESIPSIRMVLVTGPRIAKDALRVPREVEVRHYIPRLYEHFAASDLAIIQGGGTSVLELSALNRPFLYFPLEGHCEQANVARNLRERGLGIEMKFSHTSPDLLAEKILESIGSEVDYPEIKADGAQKAVRYISKLLEKYRKPVLAEERVMS